MRLFNGLKPDNKVDEKTLIERWLVRIERSQRARNPQEANWNRWAKIMDDDMWGGAVMTDGRVPEEVNELKSTIMSVLPAVILEPGVLEIRAYNVADIELAAIYERIGENLDKSLGLYKELMLNVYDAFLYGNGITKFGYWQDIMLDRPLWSGGLTGMFGDTMSAFAKHTSLLEVYPDYAAKDWDTQRYIIHEFIAHIDDIRENKEYNKKVVDKLTPGYSLRDRRMGLMSDDDRWIMEDSDYVLGYEIHDFVNRKIFMVVNGCDDDFLYEGPELYNISPFENLFFFPRPKGIWGDSISQAIERHVKSLSEAFTYMSDAVSKESVIKMIYNLAEVDPEQLKKLESPTSEWVGINSENVDGFARPLELGTSKTQYIMEVAINQLRETIRQASGVTQQERGGHERGVETKYEAQMLQGASEVRQQLRSEMFSQFCGRVFTKLLYIVSLEYPVQRLAKMAGLTDFYSYVLQGGVPFDSSRFQVRYGQTAANSRRDRMQKLSLFAQLAGPYMNPVTKMKLAADILDFDFTTEMVVLGDIAQASQQGGQQATDQIVQSRMV